jgi:hypothetical protein
MYSKLSVDAAVSTLNPALHEAIDRSIPRRSVNGSNFPSWFFRTLQHCILKKNIVTDVLKRIRLIYTTVNFPNIGKLVKTSIKPTDLVGINPLMRARKIIPSNFGILCLTSGKINQIRSVLWLTVHVGGTQSSS